MRQNVDRLTSVVCDRNDGAGASEQLECDLLVDFVVLGEQNSRAAQPVFVPGCRGLCGFASAIVTAPYLLYQIWAFVLPGLYAQERKMSRIFVAVAGPLFLAGIALGYLTLPVALEVLIGFNPDGVTNLTDFNDYLQFFTRTLLVFGLAFNIPVFVVLLNLAGVVKGASLKAYRPWIIIGTFVFAAVATPSADPFTMTLMAVPMVLLFFVSEVIARLNDRRRARNAPNAGLSPDELSAI